jgi:amidase
MSDLLFRPVHELAALVRDGDITSRELVEASLERIEALDGDIGAFVDVYADDALATADEIGAGDERPFAGVPIAIKNNKPVKGKRLTFCCDFTGDFIAPHDAFVVRRLRDAGFVIVGSTKLPEYGLLPVTEPKDFAPTRNPWDLGRTPGGSSGGAAAAVASGMVPIAHGNDGGGSIRIPAACAGLVGLKPARGRISHGPDIGDNFLSTDGVLSRTTSETAALLDVLAGYEVGDATWLADPADPFADAVGRDPGRLRIGMTVKPPLPDAVVDPLHLDAVREAAGLLEEAGHTVEEFESELGNDTSVAATFSAVFGPMVCMQIGFAAMLQGREPRPGDLDRLNQYMWERARDEDSLTYLQGMMVLQALTRMVVEATRQFDAVLMPSLGQRPLAIGELDGDGPDPADTFRRAGIFTPYTALANITGQPAISVPLAHGDDGLPVGVQLVGRPADEATLLTLSAQLEAARPWADRRPPIVAGEPA